DATNWNTPFHVKVTVNPDAPPVDLEQPKQSYPLQPHVVAELYGPLIVDGGILQVPGGTVPEFPLVNGAKLPTEHDIALPQPYIEPEDNAPPVNPGDSPNADT